MNAAGPDYLGRAGDVCVVGARRQGKMAVLYFIPSSFEMRCAVRWLVAEFGGCSGVQFSLRYHPMGMAKAKIRPYTRTRFALARIGETERCGRA